MKRLTRKQVEQELADAQDHVNATAPYTDHPYLDAEAVISLCRQVLAMDDGLGNIMKHLELTAGNMVKMGGAYNIARAARLVESEE